MQKFARNSLKRAFTLAEVLITLAIIGVVAVLTIPVLFNEYQQKAWDSSAMVFEKRLAEALRVMNTQQVLAGYKTTEDFVNELSKHMKITKICSSDKLQECMSDEVYWEILTLKNNKDWSGMEEPDYDTDAIDATSLKTAAKLGQLDWDTETVGVQFNNGTNALIAYNPLCKEDPYANQYNGLGCVAVVYDTTGFKLPNTGGKDLRVVNARLTDCNLKLQNRCYSVPMRVTYLTKAECEARKGDLGLTVCPVENDYFAAAAATCGGAANILTYATTERALIKMYLYNSLGSVENGSSLDYSRAAQLGFNVAEGETIQVYAFRTTLSDNTGYVAQYPASAGSARGDMPIGRAVPGVWTLCKLP